MLTLLSSSSKSWNLVERLLFPAPRPTYNIRSYPNELIFIPRIDGERVPCLFLPFKHARFLVIYFHANAEDLGLCYPFLQIFREQFQVHVLAVEYPGYGLCPGRADEASIMDNARAAMYFATRTLNWPYDGIKLFGRSLGTGPAIALATLYEVAGLILISPFTSIRDLAEGRIGSLAEMVRDRFRNGELAKKIASATLIVHGQRDTLIPIDHGRQIYHILDTRKMMVCPSEMGHNSSLLKQPNTFVLPMISFFSLPDYTFEDLEAPAWVFPADVPAAPLKDRHDSLEDLDAQYFSQGLDDRGKEIFRQMLAAASAKSSPRAGDPPDEGEPEPAAQQVRLSPRTPMTPRERCRARKICGVEFDGGAEEGGRQEVLAARHYEFRCDSALGCGPPRGARLHDILGLDCADTFQV